MRERRCPVCDGRGRLGLFGQYICYNCDGAGVEPDPWEEEWEEWEEEDDMEEDEFP